MIDRTAGPSPVLLAVAFLGGAELAITLGSAELDRPYLAPLAGAILLAQMAAAVLGVILWRLVRDRRRARRARSGRGTAAAGAGWAVALGTLFVLANGVPELFPAPEIGTVAAVAIAGAAGGLAALVRRSFSSRHPGIDPALVALVLVAPYAALATPARGAAVVFAAAAALHVASSLRGWLGARFDLLPVAAAALAGVLSVAGGRAPFPALPARGQGPPDVLLVVLDTTRADAVPARPGASAPTPALRRLAEEGVSYSRAFATSCWTVPAHGSLFTGLAPSEHGAHWESPRLPRDMITLAERFAASGWRTGGFSANPWISAEFDFDQGFETFREGNAGQRPLEPWLAALFPGLVSRWEPRLVLEDKAGLALVSEALRFLAAGDPRPAFVFINLMEAHLPYAPPRGFLSLEDTGWSTDALYAIDQDRLADLLPGRTRSARSIEGLRMLYEAEIVYADFLISRLIARLEEAGRYDDTLLVVTADHGENVGDHPPLDHQLGLWDTLIQVPLIARYPPRLAAGTEVDDLVSLVDLPGFLLSAAAGGPAGERLPARDAVFFEYRRPQPILERIAAWLAIDPSPWNRTLAGIRTGGAKWIEASDGRHLAFDLKRDPGEKRNLVREPGGVPEGWEPLADSLRETLVRLRSPRSTEDPFHLPEDTAKRLRSLGYVR